MRKRIGHLPGFRSIAVLLLSAIFLLPGCATTGPGAFETHQKNIGTALEDEYFVPKRPVDRHHIGSAWSRQFGPVDDPAAEEIRTKKERSLNNVQQDFAYNRGIALGGQSVSGSTAGIGMTRGSAQKADLGGVEIITPVNLSDIPFEPNVPYVTEALRLANFRIAGEKSGRTGVTGGVSSQKALTNVLGTGKDISIASAEGTIGGTTRSRNVTEGEGLVVAYKLHMIDVKSYRKTESGSQRLELDKSIDLSGTGIVAKARLAVIEPGSGKSLPRNLLWACARAEGKSRDIVAAWLVDLKSTDPKRKSLTIGFPAYPRIEDCHSFDGIVFSRLDPATDRIARLKVQLTILDADITDTFQPKEWDARVSHLDESFNVRPVRPSELEGR